jgi:4-hydroxy-2-oxoheptanedioate aldolase
MSELRPNRFKRDLGKRQMLGIFSTLASPLLAELFAEVGFDWILIDTEHSPNEAGEVVAQLQAMAATRTEAIVRPAWSDMIMVKRILDLGAQTLLFPYVQNAEEAARAVSYTRYPPRGVRGVSGSSRAARYGLVPDYFAKVEAEICVLVQIETLEALRNIEAIAAVDGVDAVFIGPADLAASMGHLGNTQHPEVQAAIDAGFAKLKALGKPAGYLTNNEAEARRRVAQGLDFVGVANDTTIVVRGARELLSAVGAPRA